MCRQFCACKAMAEPGQGEEGCCQTAREYQGHGPVGRAVGHSKASKKYGPEEWLELFLDENMILCRETFKKSIQAVSDSPYA